MIKQPVAGIILAAGRSARMGEPKALLHIGGRPALVQLVDVFRAAQLEPLVIVASGPTAVLAESLEGIEIVVGDPEQTMVDSLARAIELLRGRCGGAVVQPVDAPFTTPEMIAELLIGDGGTSRVLCHDGRPGHPVYVPGGLFGEIMERPEGGLRFILADSDVELVEWPDDRVLADLDTPADVLAWQSESDGRLH